MKIWQVSLLSALLVAAPILSACGPSNTQRIQQEAYQKAYQEALESYQESYQEQIEAYQEEFAEYQKEWQQAYQDYADNLTKWYELQAKATEAQIRQIEQSKSQ